MQRYWKGSDMRLNIHITDNKGEEIPLSSILSMTIHLFTIGCEYVEYNYPQSILEDEKGLYIPINENALAYLPDGFLRWEAHFKVKDGDWADGKDIVKGCRTDIFVKTPRDYVGKPNVQEKEISITENGEYEVLPDAGYEGISRMNINVEIPFPLEEKEVNITENESTTTIAIGEGYSGMSKVTVNVEIPFPLEEKEVNITENGGDEILPDTGYKGISRVNVNVNLDVNPYYEEGFMKFLKKEASGKIELPIEAMDTPSCLYKQTGITEVVVPEGATSIPNNFFQGCTSLEKITYPDSITSFGRDIYANISYDKIMSFPLPPYLYSSLGSNIYYRNGEVFNVPKYINQIEDIISYNNGIAKRLNFKGNLCQFYFQSFRAEEMDFRYNVQVPRFEYVSIYTGMTKVIVPESLYNTWITTSPWSDYAAITESVPDTDYFIPYQTKSGNDISLTTGVKEDRYAVISYTDKKIHLRGTPWQMADIINSNDITYVDFAASNLEVPAFSGLFRGCSSLTGFTLPPNKPFSCREMFNGCTSLTTIPEMDTSYVNDMYCMFQNCKSLSTIPPMDTSQVTTMRSMFLFCDSLTSVSEMNTSIVTDMVDMFLGCESLTDLGGFVGLNVNLKLSYCSKLTHESLLNVINKAADVTASPATIILGSTNLAKLTDAEKAIATSKGWTLA